MSDIRCLVLFFAYFGKFAIFENFEYFLNFVNMNQNGIIVISIIVTGNHFFLVIPVIKKIMPNCYYEI